MEAILQRALFNVFSGKKPQPSIDSDNGVAPYRCQAIIWTSDT